MGRTGESGTSMRVSVYPKQSQVFSVEPLEKAGLLLPLTFRLDINAMCLGVNHLMDCMPLGPEVKNQRCYLSIEGQNKPGNCTHLRKQRAKQTLVGQARRRSLRRGSEVMILTDQEN